MAPSEKGLSPEYVVAVHEASHCLLESWVGEPVRPRLSLGRDAVADGGSYHSLQYLELPRSPAPPRCAPDPEDDQQLRHALVICFSNIGK